MSAMIEYLRESGYKQTSLNVKKENYAVKLYKEIGFEIIVEDKDNYLMLLKLCVITPVLLNAFIVCEHFKESSMGSTLKVVEGF